MTKSGLQAPTFLAPVQAAWRIRPTTGLPILYGAVVDPDPPLTPPVGTRFSTGEDLPLLEGPSSAPGGAVIVTPGVDDLDSVTSANPAGTTFYLLTGTHVLGASEFDQVAPKSGNTYIGAPGAVLNGRFVNRYAFSGSATDVTVKYLEVCNFICPFDEFTVNHNAKSGWVILYCNIHNNGGAGLGVGSNNTVQYSWIHHNRQYAFSAYNEPIGMATTQAIQNVTVDHCEIHNNGDPRDEVQPNGNATNNGRNGGCKFWDTNNPVMTHNWIHHSHLVGIWADTNNVGMRVEQNLIEDNYGQGFFYEISYNFLVRSNTFRRNCISSGLRGNYQVDGFPDTCIYISESGSEPRTSGNYNTLSEIRSNLFQNNWDDIALWENSDRFCNSTANTSSKLWKPLGGAASLAACNNPTPRVLTVTLTNGSPNFVVTAGTFVDDDEGQFVSGTGIPLGTKIQESYDGNGFTGGYVDSSHGIMTENATTSGSVTMTLAGGTINVNPAYYDCRWHTSNILISNNVFESNRSEILGARNTLQGSVVTGKHALFSQAGSFPSWSPYQGTAIMDVMFSQNDLWQSNTYRGDYVFVGPDNSDHWTFAQWQVAPRNQDNGSNHTATPPTNGTADRYKSDPPTSITAVAGDTQARVFLTPPPDSGGEMIVGYEVTSSPGGITANSVSGPVTITGLTNGVAYTFTVKARTTIGDSVASSASNSVTPTGGFTLPSTTIPWQPVYQAARRRTATTVEVSFSRPISDGSSTITNYTATASPGGLTGSAAYGPITVSGLTEGVEYTFTVTATNAVGTGPLSQPTTPVTP